MKMVLISGLGLRFLFRSSSITNACSGRSALAHVRGFCTKFLTKLFVGGLSGHTNDQVLKDTFSHYGQVLEASVIVNPTTGRSKGYGFVKFASETEADNALKEMDGKLLNGRNIHVDFAKPVWKYVGEDPPRAVGPPSWIPGKDKKKLKKKKGS